MADSTNKRFIAAELDQDEHRLLVRLAAEWGRHPSDLIAVAVRKFLLDLENVPEGKEKPLDLRVFQTLGRMRKGSDIELYLRDMALAYQAQPTDENAQLLQDTAEECGYTVEQLLQWIEEDRLVPLGNMSTTVDVAKAFLDHHLQPGKEYPSLDIQEAATKEGINSGALNTAKRALNIRSVRRGSCWVWTRD